MPPHRKAVNVSGDTFIMRNLLLYFLVFARSCQLDSENYNGKVNREHSDTIDLKLWVNPAFEEAAELFYLKTDTSARITVLIKNNHRFDSAEDTFYFVEESIDPKEWIFLDTTIVEKSREKISFRDRVTVDGITIGIYNKINAIQIGFTFRAPNNQLIASKILFPQPH
jgi:hypothetical protein